MGDDVSLNVHMLTSRFLPLITLGKFHVTPRSTGILSLASVNVLKMQANNSVFQHIGGRGRESYSLRTSAKSITNIGDVQIHSKCGSA